MLTGVVIPEKITVHLGSPKSQALNVTLPFPDYIKNVCSSEIFPTWPEASIEANIYCQVSLALNRIYTEWYRSRGYDFDITNDTAYDQYFVYGRNIFANIDAIVDRIFNRFVQRAGHKEPYYTEYCDGIKANCPGLKQWGTVALAEQGMKPLEILRYYYPKDIQIVETDNIKGVQGSYPGHVLKEGMSGPEIKTIQDHLNRIRMNFPQISQINNPNGYFGPDTTAAVKSFQLEKSFSLSVVDGIVGKNTWYKISFIYTAVKKLAELTGEGEIISITRTPPSIPISEGSKGTDVGRLQYILNFISNFYPGIPSVIEGYSFNKETKAAVIAFQTMFRLTPDGKAGPGTWKKLYEVYWGIKDNMKTKGGAISTYPGYTLKIGSSGAIVRQIQRRINNISKSNPTIPKQAEDGILGSGTRDAIIAFQKTAGLTADGVVGKGTWDKLMSK